MHVKVQACIFPSPFHLSCRWNKDQSYMAVPFSLFFILFEDDPTLIFEQRPKHKSLACSQHWVSLLKFGLSPDFERNLVQIYFIFIHNQHQVIFKTVGLRMRPKIYRRYLSVYLVLRGARLKPRMLSEKKERHFLPCWTWTASWKSQCALKQHSCDSAGRLHV